MTETVKRLQATPSLVTGIALLVWGWQCQLLPYAITMALLIEIRPWLKWRWAITDREFNTLSDFSGVVFFLSVIYIFSTEGARGIFVVLKVLPFILFPLLLVQNYSEKGLMKLSALIVSLRRLEAHAGPERDRAFDIGLPYFLLCLVSASAGNQRTPLFLGIVALLLVRVLWFMRSRRFTALTWIASITIAFSIAWNMQIGLRHLQASIEASFVGMFDQFMWRYRDPNRATTAIGSLGRLKLSDRIVLRVKPGDEPELPILLKEASYSSFGHGIWSTSDKEFLVIDQNQTGDWTLVNESSSDRKMSISTYMIREKGVVPLPHGSNSIENVTAIEVARNPHGAVSMDIREGWIEYDVRYTNQSVNEAPPDENDLFLLDYHRQDLEKVAVELGLPNMSQAEAVETVKRFFRENFSYTLNYRQRYPRGRYLADFLNRTRQGHCEYFATATALLLRSVGIPTRYAVGYSVDEYSRLEGQYVARSRHAHSWTLVHLDGSWQVLDTTPSVWAPFEAENASAFEPFMDLWSWISYRWEMFQSRDVTEDEEGNNWLLWLLLPLTAFLGWRIYFRERVELKSARASEQQQLNRQGLDSEFYALTDALEKQYLPREKGENLTAWLHRLADFIPITTLEITLALHYRYRFDPAGVSDEERNRLSQLASAAIRRFQKPNPVRGNSG